MTQQEPQGQIEEPKEEQKLDAPWEQPLGLVGEKCGMSRVFDSEGRSIAVTLVRVQGNRMLRCLDKSGGVFDRQAKQAGRALIAWGKPPKSIGKALAGEYAKAGVEASRKIVSFRISSEQANKISVGGELPITQFATGDMLDVTGVSKGKGFAGTVKRWNFATQDTTHGNSLAHRKPGSIGQCQTPGKVWKGKKMAGHMGNAKVTVQNLKLATIDVEAGLLAIEGGIPGPVGGQVVIRPAVKKGVKRS